jgi:hypothetical protein
MPSDILTRTNQKAMTTPQVREYQSKDYTKCDDRLHIMIDNGLIIRNIYCCPRHRYRTVEYSGKDFIQERTDREIDNLAYKFKNRELPLGWE